MRGRVSHGYFRKSRTLGRELEALGARTLGGRTPAQVAILFDWENWWAIEYSSGPTIDLKYVEQCQQFFAALHDRTIVADVVSPDADLSQYKVVIAPVLYMVKAGIAEKLEAFVQNGGRFVTTFFSGIADETDLVYLGGYPGPLRRLLGIWAEEIDALMPGQTNKVRFDAPFGDLPVGDYDCRLLCDRIHAEGADVLATYSSDFYAGEPAVTRNAFGDGFAYYLATDLETECSGTISGTRLRRGRGRATSARRARRRRSDGTRVSRRGTLALHPQSQSGQVTVQPA